jgi:hypothetical protein
MSVKAVYRMPERRDKTGDKRYEGPQRKHQHPNKIVASLFLCRTISHTVFR